MKSKLLFLAIIFAYLFSATAYAGRAVRMIKDVTPSEMAVKDGIVFFNADDHPYTAGVYGN